MGAKEEKEKGKPMEIEETDAEVERREEEAEE